MMSLIRQVWLMLLGVLLLALVGSVATHTLVARQALQTQLQVRNDDGAMMLALALSQQQGDAARMQLVAAAQFDTGHYRQLRLLGPDGSLIFERELPERTAAAPSWFARLLPVAAAPGVAPVSDGWRPVGTVQLSSQADWALDALWAGSLGMAGWLALLGLAAAALAALAVRSWRRPLDATVAQAQALQEQHFVIADEPRVPELRRLTRSMNSLVRRLQAVFEHQAAALEALRKQAHADALTGLTLRRHFVAQMEHALRAENNRGAGLVLVRLRHLDAMNRRIGREAADRLLAALAQVLQTYPQHVKGALTGRLNGTDFALYLPAAGMAEESARSLLEALRVALAAVDREAELAVGGAELPLPCSAALALARADGALAQAESDGAFAMSIAPATSADQPVHGEGDWQDRLTAALGFGRARLMERELRDALGRLLHLDCPMHLQLEPGGPFEPATRWLAMAVRCRRVEQADLCAADLALHTIAQDGLPRCIKVAAASLTGPGFAPALQQRLNAAPQAATRLWIDVAEAASLQPRRLREAITGWQRCGVRVGLEHAGARLRQLSNLHALGVDYIKIDGAVVQGVATRAEVQDLVRGLVALLRGMQVQILAEDVQDEADLAALWALGFDGATGPAVR
jgi:EAL domain-containing protein (putative c-di-GMP-specific phosphodiesterase class I)/GGDEF domain-containing protein